MLSCACYNLLLWATIDVSLPAQSNQKRIRAPQPQRACLRHRCYLEQTLFVALGSVPRFVGVCEASYYLIVLGDVVTEYTIGLITGVAGSVTSGSVQVSRAP